MLSGLQVTSGSPILKEVFAVGTADGPGWMGKSGARARRCPLECVDVRRVLIRFPIVVYESESDDMGRFTAHCLNMDLLADADTLEEAVSRLLETIEVQLDAAEEHAADPFNRAPERYWQMLGQSKEIPAEWMDRIIARANERRTAPQCRIDLRGQCEIRRVEPVMS